MDEVISELNLALVECRENIVRSEYNPRLEHLAEVASKIEQVLKLLNSINDDAQVFQRAVLGVPLRP